MVLCKLKQALGKAALAFEIVLVAILALGFAAACKYYSPLGVFLSSLLKDNGVAFYLSFAALFGSLLGFVLASITVLAGFASTSRLRLLREAGHLLDIWKTYSNTLYILFGGLAASLLAVLVDSKSIYIFIALAALAALGLMNLLWCICEVSRITKLILQKGESDSKGPTVDSVHLWLTEELNLLGVPWFEPGVPNPEPISEKIDGVKVQHAEQWCLHTGRRSEKIADVLWANSVGQVPLRFRFRPVGGKQVYKYFNGDIGAIAQWIAEMTRQAEQAIRAEDKEESKD